MRARGMSLVEITVVIAVLGVLAAIAVPNLLPLLHAGKVSGTALQIAGFVDSARARAVAEGRCMRVRAVGAELVLERRTGTDCVHLDKESWSQVRTLPLPGATLTIEALTTDVVTPADNRLIFRPSSRLRGDGDKVTSDDHARVAFFFPDIDQRALVEVMATGRICTRKVGPTFPPLAVFACP